jgi:hypothetical protein
MFHVQSSGSRFETENPQTYVDIAHAKTEDFRRATDGLPGRESGAGWLTLRTPKKPGAIGPASFGFGLRSGAADVCARGPLVLSTISKRPARHRSQRPEAFRAESQSGGRTRRTTPHARENRHPLDSVEPLHRTFDHGPAGLLGPFLAERSPARPQTKTAQLWGGFHDTERQVETATRHSENFTRGRQLRSKSTAVGYAAARMKAKRP